MDNDGNQKMVIIENIMEDSIEVNYENKSITYSPHISLDLLNMAIKSIIFLESKFFILLSALCWLMLQIIEGKWEEILCYAIKIQVSKPDQVTKAFEVFVYLEWKISNFDY